MKALPRHLRDHALGRLRERAGLRLTGVELGEMAAAIRARDPLSAQCVRELKNGRSEWRVRYRARWVRVVWDPRAKAVITALP
jgi:hypothetical protein